MSEKSIGGKFVLAVGIFFAEYRSGLVASGMGKPYPSCGAAAALLFACIAGFDLFFFLFLSFSILFFLLRGRETRK